MFGGAEEDRTPDPLRARQVLSQLSYDPFFTSIFSFTLRCVRSLVRLHTDVCALSRLLRASIKEKSLAKMLRFTLLFNARAAHLHFFRIAS